MRASLHVRDYRAAHAAAERVLKIAPGEPEARKAKDSAFRRRPAGRRYGISCYVLLVVSLAEGCLVALLFIPVGSHVARDYTVVRSYYGGRSLSYHPSAPAYLTALGIAVLALVAGVASVRWWPSLPRRVRKSLPWTVALVGFLAIVGLLGVVG
jgi:hypothetical protein